MENEKYTINYWLEMAAITIIFICIVCLLSLLGCKIYKMIYNKPIVNTVNIVTSDSLQNGGKTYYVDKKITDSLSNILTQHERELSDKYQYVIDQKDDKDNVYTIGGIFVGVVISIFSLFGYKSLKSIEDHTKDEAKDIAEHETKNYMDKHVKQMVGEKSEELFNSEAALRIAEKIKADLNAFIEIKITNAKAEMHEEKTDLLVDAVKIKLTTEGLLNNLSKNEDNIKTENDKDSMENKSESEKLKEGGLE